MEIKDLIGISEPLKKMIDVISKGIGVIYEPKRIRAKADADAYRIEIEAKAEAKKTLIEGEAKIELLERAKKRLVFQELQRQQNIEDIAEKAIYYLNEENTSQEEVDVDWISRFFSYAQEIQSEDAKEIWAKILAREVENPDSISLRCLNSLRNISNKEAKIFTKLCSLLSDNSYVIRPFDYDSHTSILGIKYEDIQLLQDSGLLVPHHLNSIIIKKEIEQIVTIGTTKYILEVKDKKSYSEDIKRHILTNVGKEIYSIMSVEYDLNYNENILEYLRSKFIINSYKDDR